MVDIKKKMAMLTGETAWTTLPIEEINLPSIKMTDGACGVRNGDIAASCFPSPVSVASSFDVDAVYNFAKVLAKDIIT